jgi:hypothetical protein
MQNKLNIGNNNQLYMQEMGRELRVHITVIGFEVDRISQAAIDHKADIVYLISKDDEEKGKIYLEENERILTENRIEVKKRTVSDVHDLTAVLKKMKEIIREEKNNSIYINVSSGSIPAAIAGTIVATMFEDGYQIKPYYVKPETYLNPKSESDELQPRTEGIKEIQEISIFPAKLPDERLTKVLIKIHENGPIFKQKLITFSIETLGYDAELKKDDKYGSKEHTWVNKNIVEKLDRWGFINITKVGRNSKISLTNKGKNMVEYLSD